MDLLFCAAAAGLHLPGVCCGQAHFSKLKLPAILGWLNRRHGRSGPTGWTCSNEAVLESGWFDVTERILESVFGLMIGTELDLEADEKGRAQDPGHHHHRVSGGPLWW